ncbi:MAG TPA: hypothetical protein VIW24_23565 [Aldersonia sp.]
MKWVDEVFAWTDADTEVVAGGEVVEAHRTRGQPAAAALDQPDLGEAGEDVVADRFPDVRGGCDSARNGVGAIHAERSRTSDRAP